MAKGIDYWYMNRAMPTIEMPTVWLILYPIYTNSFLKFASKNKYLIQAKARINIVGGIGFDNKSTKSTAKALTNALLRIHTEAASYIITTCSRVTARESLGSSVSEDQLAQSNEAWNWGFVGNGFMEVVLSLPRDLRQTCSL